MHGAVCLHANLGWLLAWVACMLYLQSTPVSLDLMPIWQCVSVVLIIYQALCYAGTTHVGRLCAPNLVTLALICWAVILLNSGLHVLHRERWYITATLCVVS
jgi:hypothetical protein